MYKTYYDQKSPSMITHFSLKNLIGVLLIEFGIRHSPISRKLYRIRSWLFLVKGSLNFLTGC